MPVISMTNRNNYHKLYFAKYNLHEYKNELATVAHAPKTVSQKIALVRMRQEPFASAVS